MLTLNARYDGKVFIPEQEVNLPAGCELELTISPRNGSAESKPQTSPASMTLADLARIATEYPDDPAVPEDLAAQHDHYLYGTRKR